jgi:hypothetical protein
MSILASNTDALLVGVPMVVFLFVALFRLDELVCKSRKPGKRGREFCAWGEDGIPICPDPARIVSSAGRRRY